VAAQEGHRSRNEDQCPRGCDPDGLLGVDVHLRNVEDWYCGCPWKHRRMFMLYSSNVAVPSNTADIAERRIVHLQNRVCARDQMDFLVDVHLPARDVKDQCCARNQMDFLRSMSTCLHAMLRGFSVGRLSLEAIPRIQQRKCLILPTQPDIAETYPHCPLQECRVCCTLRGGMDFLGSMSTRTQLLRGLVLRSDGLLGGCPPALHVRWFSATVSDSTSDEDTLLNSVLSDGSGWQR
jgi:hypothetical protein